MHARARRLGSALAVTVVAFAVLAGTSRAAALGLATLSLSAATGMAGSEVTVTGSGFAPTGAPLGTVVGGQVVSTIVGGNVTIRWGTADGPVLATETADAVGVLAAATLTIPLDARPGSYAIVATQFDQNGRAIQGTPGLAGFTVKAGRAGAVQQPIAGPPEQMPASVQNGLNAEFVIMLVVAGLTTVVVLGVGLEALTRVFRRGVPSKSPPNRR